ncbi:MAG: small-conductance mechanosensitive channel [Paracoccaceae bacterium]
MFRNLVSFLLFSVVLGLMVSPAQAQISLGGSAPAAPAEIVLPDPLTPEAVRELVAHMSDDQVRSLLLDRLDALAAAEAAPQENVSLITKLENTWVAFYTPVLGAVRKIPAIVPKQLEAISNFAVHYGGSGLLTLFGFTALALAAGLAAEFLVNWVTRRWQRTEVPQDDSTLWTSLSYLFHRLLREVAGLIGFYIVVRTVGLALLTPDQLKIVGPFVTYLIWFPRLGAALARFVLAPQRADLRLVNADDETAGFLYRNLVGLILLTGFTKFLLLFIIASGVPLTDSRVGFWLDCSVYVYLGVIAWKAREGLVQIMRGTDPDRTDFDETVARAYPYYTLVVLVVLWATVQILVGFGHIALLLTGPHYTTMFWLLTMPALDTLIRGLVRHLAPPMIGGGPVAEGAYKSTKRSYIRIGRVIVGAFVLLMVAQTWNIDLLNLAAAGVGDQFAANLIEFLMVSAVGYVIFEMVSLWINRQLAKEQTAGGPADEEASEGGGAGGSRLTTVLPLIRMTAQAAIAVIFGLVALSSLGIDTTPLLAGAGILGLAIGFGAQKLVTDIVSGIFFLVDDAFRVGEYVDIGGTMGTVEKISIRSMQLRHHRGLVHTIPYGEIPKLTNFSRDWVIMKLMFTVPFDTDPNKVKKIFKKIGAEMSADPLYENDFLEPFKSQGVLQFDDVGIVMRGKFMAKPGTQFTIRKEIYNRVRTEFAANGIEFARREVRVAIPGLERIEDLTEENKSQIAATAAAADVARRQLEQEKLEQEKK